MGEPGKKKGRNCQCLRWGFHWGTAVAALWATRRLEDSARDSRPAYAKELLHLYRIAT
jgi:hypothetical protein